VSLLEMTGAYQALADRGQLVPPTAILKITDNFGREIEPARPRPRPVLNEAHAYLITDILADNEARTPAFGPDSPLHLSRPAAVKTGTTNDFRDSWTIGYTPDLVAGVWVGNADNTAMLEVSGDSGAAPIWQQFMEQAHQDLPLRNFVRPPTIIDLEVCVDSGTLPSEVCPAHRREIFYKAQPPLGPEHDIHQMIEIDFNSGLLVNEFCRSNVGKRYYQVYPPDGQEWALSHGLEQPPTKYCPSANLVARLTAPVDNTAVRGIIALRGVAIATNFAYYQLELGAGTEPQHFVVIQNPTTQLIDNDILAIFDTTQLENGPYTLRLVVFDKVGGLTEARSRILVDNSPEGFLAQQPVTTPPASPTLTATVTLTLPLGTPSPQDLTSQPLTQPLTIPPVPDTSFTSGLPPIVAGTPSRQ
jgi:hypothetical protein